MLNDSNTQADADQNESTDAGDETQEGEDVYTSVKFSEMFFQGSFEYFSKLFPVTVSVSDVIYGDKLSGATITIDGEKYLSNEQGTVDFEFSKGMHYYTISASGYLLKSGYFEVDQEYNSESVMAIELELQAQYNSNDNKISSWLIVAIIAFLALNVFFTLLYVFRKE